MDMHNRPIAETDPSEDNKVSHVFPCIARASMLMGSGMRIDLLPLMRTR